MGIEKPEIPFLVHGRTNTRDSGNGEKWLANLLLSFVFTWTVGLVPPLLIRHGIFRRRLGKVPAVIIVTVFLFGNLIFFEALGSHGGHPALVLIAFASYALLTGGRQRMAAAKAGTAPAQTLSQDDNAAERPSISTAPTALPSSEHGEQTPTPVECQPTGDARIFVVIGVEKESGRDVQLSIRAWSSENARVKAELQGVIATDIVPAED